MKKKIKEKQNIKQSKNNSIDYFILVVFILSMIVPIIVAVSQQFIVQYGDDISVINWARTHSVSDVFTSKLGTGYRPMMNFFYIFGYTLWGSEAKYYYLFSGLIFSGGMIFLYLLGKILHSRLAGFIAVILYLFLDASFILVSKINFIVTTGEIFFITSALYFSVKYFKNKDKISNWIAIILSIFAFLTKEPSLLIIPASILTYLYFNKMLNKKYIFICIIPYLYVFLEMILISPDIGSGNTNIIEKIYNNANFYFKTEIDSQFKTSILLGISLLVSLYYIYYSSLKKEILLCVIWFLAGITPFLFTQQPVQPTYLAEANLGMGLLLGIVISEGLRKNNIISAFLIIGIIFQVILIPNQITNMQNYNRLISDNQNTFLETILDVKILQKNEIVFYISEDTRKKYGYSGVQITEGFFKDYLCIEDLCDIKVTTNYNETNYIVLPSTLDVQIFQKEYPEESKRLQVIKQIQHNNDYGFILKKV